MRLYLLRHGRPLVGPGICYGGSDVGVDVEEHGRVLAQALPRLPMAVPIYSSPLRRCSELAERLAGLLHAPLQIDARLREMHFGAWEMQDWDAIPRADIDAWSGDLLHYRPGGGESVLQAARRVMEFHQALSASGASQAIVVCHAGIMRLLARCGDDAGAEQIGLDAASAGHGLDYGELLILDFR